MNKTNSESIPVGVQSLLSKLYFLAQINGGKKPCMSDMSLVESSSWIGSFHRWWNSEDRKTVITDIKQIITETIDALKQHKNNMEFLKLIINALANARVGVESMLTTYRDDPSIIGRIKVQLANMDLQLENYRHFIKGYNIIEVINEMENPEKLENDEQGKPEKLEKLERRKRRHRKVQDDTESIGF